MRHNRPRLLHALLTLAVLVLTGLSAQAGSGTFRPYVAYPVDSDLSRGIAVADLNGDGIPDLASAAGNTLNILLGNGDGSFQPYLTYPLSGDDSELLVLADVNADGKVDVIVGNSEQYQGSVGVLLGNGDGSFQDHVDYPVAFWPKSLVAADFNNDGNNDIAVTSQDDSINSRGRLCELLGNGDGTFQKARNFDTGTKPNKLVTADFNHDGNLDVAIRSDTGTRAVIVMYGDGHGRFGPAWYYGDNSDWGDLALGDFNGDGREDVVASMGYLDEMEILLGNGKGRLAMGSFVSVAHGAQEVQVADFNADGNADIATLGYWPDGFLNVLMGNGDDTFQAPVEYSLADSSERIVAADLNLDGAVDLVNVNSWMKSILVLFNNSGTQLSLTSSANPSNFGDPVSFTLVVVPSFSDAGTPAGRIKFQDGTTVLGEVSLTDGQASFTTSALTQGSHTISAVYSGDSTFNRHKSESLVQEVQ